MTKICYKCKQRKPVAEFSRDQYKSDGYRTQCKRCEKLQRCGVSIRPKTQDKGVSLKEGGAQADAYIQGDKENPELLEQEN